MKKSGEELFQHWFSIAELILSDETCKRLGTDRSNNLNLLRMLFYFFCYDPCDNKVKEIAAKIGISCTCASDTVQKLVEDGVLDRNPRHGDRRAVQLTLTQHGKALRTELFSILAEHISNRPSQAASAKIQEA